MARMEQTVTLM